MQPRRGHCVDRPDRVWSSLWCPSPPSRRRRCSHRRPGFRRGSGRPEEDARLRGECNCTLQQLYTAASSWLSLRSHSARSHGCSLPFRALTTRPLVAIIAFHRLSPAFCRGAAAAITAFHHLSPPFCRGTAAAIAVHSASGHGQDRRVLRRVAALGRGVHFLVIQLPCGAFQCLFLVFSLPFGAFLCVSLPSTRRCCAGTWCTLTTATTSERGHTRAAPAFSLPPPSLIR